MTIKKLPEKEQDIMKLFQFSKLKTKISFIELEKVFKEIDKLIEKNNKLIFWNDLKQIRMSACSH